VLCTEWKFGATLTRLAVLLVTARSSVAGAVELMPVLATTRIGKYYRTTVPREVRRILELKANDEIEWVLESDKVVVRRRQGSRG